MVRLSADLLQAVEVCERRGHWTRDWEPKRLSANQMLSAAMRVGLTETRDDYGEAAGETVMELAVERGLQMPASRNLHDSVVHHAALADMLTTAVRRPGPPWKTPPAATFAGYSWKSSAFLSPDGSELRRVVLVTSWNDDRHYSEIRSWYGMGECAAYGLPMTMVVLILGQHRDGRRQGPFSRGFQHPRNHALRFRKRSKSTSEVFSDSWTQIWREDHAEISNRAWLQAMLEDDILRDVCFTVPIRVPSAEDRRRLSEMAERKLARLEKTARLPEASLSVCDRPRCPFLDVCLNTGPTPSGFISLAEVVNGEA